MQEDLKARNANLDALRCLAMFLIVMGHVYNHGVFFRASNSLDMVFDYALKWHVDAFLALSGWFGVRFSLRKFLRLYGLIAFYSLISYVIGLHCCGLSVWPRITGGWYGNTYLCLMLVVPLLNEGINGLIKMGKREAWLAWCGFALVIFVNWMSGNSYVGLIAYDISPFSLVQMVFVYFTVRLIRLTDVTEKVRLWHIAAAIAVYFLCARFVPVARTNYIAPYTIVMAVSILILFEKFVKIPVWLGKACVWAAPSMFGVYLLHEVSSYGKMFHRIPLDFCVSLGLSPAMSIVCATFVCFVVCMLLETGRGYLWGRIKRKLQGWAG